MLFKNSVRTSKRTPHFTITGINWLTLFKEINNRCLQWDPYKNQYIQNAALLTVKTDVSYGYRSALKG
jgi:hypothetical protein